ncbi:CocE/NonD family hydrolase C-terminal non-catalytic domain-containing protein [Nonomuraea sp. NPDC049607]|uniref:CocE/NonD family hydrolase C-terminal non-catalytic domain-containing protein n=1 Tax=Nonomuraea sp. NPDC049607 TaxID=3154732 RepID=UPI00343B3FE0
MRHLDENLAADDMPAHSFDWIEKLSPGQIVALDIDLFPIGMSFQPGERLRFVVSGRHLLGPMMPALVEYIPTNKGLHVIHTGGEHASYLQLPVQAR